MHADVLSSGESCRRHGDDDWYKLLVRQVGRQDARVWTGEEHGEQPELI